jgi:hypothetical protein
MKTATPDLQDAVRTRYAGIAEGARPPEAAERVARAVGYDASARGAVRKRDSYLHEPAVLRAAGREEGPSSPSSTASS